MKIDKPGIYDNVPMESYIADPCPEPSLSKGVIGTIIDRSPLHAYAEHPRLGAKDDTHSNEASMGSAIHGLVCGGAERIVWLDFDNYATKDAKAARDAAYAAKQIPMLSKLKDPCEEAAGIISDFIKRRYGPGKFEQTVIWQEKNGVWCRTRPDFIADDITGPIVDLKTCKDAEPVSWQKSSLGNSDYPIQAAHGQAGVQTVLGEESEREFIFLAAEVEYPHGVSANALEPEYVEDARAKRNRAVRIWRRCLDTNTFPGYAERTHYAPLPVYLAKESERRNWIADAEQVAS